MMVIFLVAESVYALRMTPSASTLVAGTVSGFVRIYDVASSEKVGKLRGHTACIKAISFLFYEVCFAIGIHALFSSRRSR